MTNPYLRSPSKNPYYQIWVNMIHRCEDSRRRDYQWYGARGIEVDPNWHDFDTFVNDILGSLGPKPEGATLDRIDVNDSYTINNVRWATRMQQHEHMRPPKLRGGSSQYRGVSWYRGTRKWMVQGNNRGIKTRIGLFANEVEAAKAYDEWALSEFGIDYEGFNFPQELV
jgi:hypothetical protein